MASTIPAPGREPSIGLDLVRGVAALAVVLFHVRAVSMPAFGDLAAGDRSPGVMLVYGMSNFGHEAVLIFFVLSGYLVFGPVLAKARRFDPGRYALDRSTRILLPLAPACLLMAIAAAAWGEPLPAFTAIAHATGLNYILVETSVYNAPLWTIAHEIWFYVFGAAVGLLMIDKRSLAGWLVLAVAGLAFIALNPLYLLFWVAGGMIAKARVKRFGWLGLAGIVLLLGGTLLYELAEAGAGPAWAPMWVGETLVALGMVMLLPALVARPVQMMLRPLAGVATGLSAISYSLYLVHYPVMKLTELLVPPTNGGIAVSIVDLCLRALVCIAVSILFYFAVEARTQWVRQHVLDWGRRAGQARARLIRGPLRSR